MANKEMKASVVVDLDDKSVTQGARNITKNTENMTRNMIRNSQRVSAQYGKMNKGISVTANNIKSLAMRAAALYAGTQSIRQTWEFNDGLRELQRSLGLNTEELEKYKQLLFDIQLRYGANKVAFTQYIDEVARGVKTYEDLEEKAKLGALAIQGLGMDGKQAANFDWLMKEVNGHDPEGALNRAASIGQNVNGRFNGNELLEGAYQVMQNWSGPKDQNAVYDIMTFLQMQSADTQNIGDAVANFQALIGDLSSQRDFLKKRFNVDVFENKDNKLILKNLQPIIDMITKDTQDGRVSDGLWHDQSSVIQGKFSEGGAKAFLNLSGQKEEFEKVRNNSGANINDIALDRSRSFVSSVEKLMSVLERFADMNLAGPIDELSKAIASLDPQDVQDYLNILKEVGTYVGGAYVAYKGGKMIKGAYDGAKDLLGTAADVQKVFVTNMNQSNPMNNNNLGIKSAGFLGLLESMQFVLDRAKDDNEKRDVLREEYGDDNITRWMKEQGYGFFDSVNTINAKELQTLILKGQVTDQYDVQKISTALNKDRSFFSPEDKLKSSSYDDLIKFVESNAAALSKPISVQGDVSVESKITVEVRAAEGLTARVQGKDTEARGSLKTPEKLGYTGGGGY